MKKVLFPTDFSDNALNAFDYACHFAQRAQAELIVFNAYNVPVLSSNESNEDIKEADFNIRDNRLERLEDFVHRYENDKRSVGLHDLHFTLEAESGQTVETIQTAAAKFGIGITIMGTQGINARPDGSFGSITSSLVMKVGCPVLIIPASLRFRPPTEIVYALDLKDAEADTIYSLKAFADLFGAHIKFLHIKSGTKGFNDKQFVNYQRTLHRLTDLEEVSMEFIENTDPLTALNTYLDMHPVDLLAMKTRKHSLLAYVMERSMTRKMMDRKDIPLLAFHE